MENDKRSLRLRINLINQFLSTWLGQDITVFVIAHLKIAGILFKKVSLKCLFKSIPAVPVLLDHWKGFPHCWWHPAKRPVFIQVSLVLGTTRRLLLWERRTRVVWHMSRKSTMYRLEPCHGCSDTRKQIVHAPVTSRIDFCNSQLVGLLDSMPRTSPEMPGYCRLYHDAYKEVWAHDISLGANTLAACCASTHSTSSLSSMSTELPWTGAWLPVWQNFSSSTILLVLCVLLLIALKAKWAQNGDLIGPLVRLVQCCGTANLL